MPPAIRRVVVRNYKSIADAAVDLGPLTVLVGPNGSGKSNFLDALAFVQECLSSSIELAARNRGGIAAVRRRSAGHPTHVAIRLELDLGDVGDATYEFEIAAKPREAFRVSHEYCSVGKAKGEQRSFEVGDGRFAKPIADIRPQLAPDRLALFAASATDEFRPVYDFLTHMRFYSIVPDRIRQWHEPDPGEWLKRDGSNAAAVLRRLRRDRGSHDRFERLSRLLANVAASLESVDSLTDKSGGVDRLQFNQDIGEKHPWAFDALSMSDGTLRVLGILLALYQPGQASLVAVEEPEATVHPGVAELVTGVLVDASSERQVLVTTHSPDILDSRELRDDQIRAVTMQRGRTIIAPLAEAARKAIRERLYTAGELLRADELAPDLEQAQAAVAQASLFGAPDRTEGGGT